MVTLEPFDDTTQSYEDVKQLYREIWGEDEGLYVDNHVTYEGWCGFVAVDDTSVIGFVWGYRSKPGQWFNDRASEALPGDVYREWFQDSFEFVEFGIHPDHRQCGVGTALHEALFEAVETPTAVTVTAIDNTAAKRFYTNRGWEIVKEPVSFTGSEQVLLGLELPL